MTQRFCADFIPAVCKSLSSCQSDNEEQNCHVIFPAQLLCIPMATAAAIHSRKGMKKPHNCITV